MGFITLDTEMHNEQKDVTAPAKLRVVGVGGGGCNAIESMMKRGLNGVEYVAINTDAQVLKTSSADHKIQVGNSITRGLGAGADPRVGKTAVEEDRKNIEKVLKGSDMVFVTAGMGGGTGTGGAPIVASIAKSLGALVVGIVTTPFNWEGKKRSKNANKGIEEFKQFVDSLIVIPNQRLLNILDKNIPAAEAFDKPNEVLWEATRGIADIITITGIINVDFADVRSVMKESGDAIMGCGVASGDDRAVEAAKRAIKSPLLEGVDIHGAKNILLNVTGSNTLTMQEIDDGNQVIYEAAGEETNVIFGWVNKEEMGENVSYTVIATGFNNEENEKDAFIEAETVKQEATQEAQEVKKVAVGGSDEPVMMQYDGEIKQDDMSIPTIFRVNANNGQFNSNVLNSGGFSYSTQNNVVTEEEPELFSEEEAEPVKVEKETEETSFINYFKDWKRG